MSKRRREEENDGDPGDQRESALGLSWDELSLPPLESVIPSLETCIPPFESVRSLSPSDLSVQPVLMPQTLPSPQCMSFTDPEDLSDSEQFDFSVETSTIKGPSLNPENFDQPLVETEHIAQPYNAARSSDVCSQMSTTQISCTAGLMKDSFALPAATGDLFFSSHEDLGTHLELHGDSDQISGQPSSSNETTMLLNDPVSIVEAFVSNEHLECDELPFINVLESFSFDENRHSLQEEETQPKTSQEEEEAALFTTSGYVTESFFDALDAEPLPEGDLLTSDPPLYDGASVTVTEATTALLTFMLGCKISGEVMEHLISLLNLLLPSCHKLVTSLFSFHKYFEHIKTPLNFIYHCTICYQKLEAKDSQCDKCKNETKVGFYLHVPIIDQLRCLYARPGFVDLLSYRHQRVKKVPENIEDIYDGTFYRSFEGSLGPLDITLMWNTDGLSLYKSSNYQIWPIYFTINELPPELRHKEENLILGGIAIGYEKPRPNLLLKPLYEELKCLEKGVDIIVYGKDNPDQVKCCLMCGTADAPAKALFFRITQFNGHFGCHCCYIKGEKSDRTDQIFVYPFEEELRPRSKEAYKDDLKNLNNGVKGPTYLFYMVCNFFMLSTAIDCMHNVYLGICRQIFTIWFSSDYFKLVFGDKAEKKP
ncbi:hypothetical protein KUF71_002024 [Frankliniella fusca]|uniref:Uncharacterized protein n=1 Tax=Frankliniella fusca TaxID=407009 RepID=A0AAE1LKJ5_9NEOP|nr:hypothetical protein KUF71_002024 [Frankliniella fusca]